MHKKYSRRRMRKRLNKKDPFSINNYAGNLTWRNLVNMGVLVPSDREDNASVWDTKIEKSNPHVWTATMTRKKQYRTLKASPWVRKENALGVFYTRTIWLRECFVPQAPVIKDIEAITSDDFLMKSIQGTLDSHLDWLDYG